MLIQLIYKNFPLTHLLLLLMNSENDWEVQAKDNLYISSRGCVERDWIF